MGLPTEVLEAIRDALLSSFPYLSEAEVKTLPDGRLLIEASGEGLSGEALIDGRKQPILIYRPLSAGVRVRIGGSRKFVQKVSGRPRKLVQKKASDPKNFVQKMSEISGVAYDLAFERIVAPFDLVTIWKIAHVGDRLKRVGEISGVPVFFGTSDVVGTTVLFSESGVVAVRGQRGEVRTLGDSSVFCVSDDLEVRTYGPSGLEVPLFASESAGIMIEPAFTDFVVGGVWVRGGAWGLGDGYRDAAIADVRPYDKSLDRLEADVSLESEFGSGRVRVWTSRGLSYAVVDGPARRAVAWRVREGATAPKGSFKLISPPVRGSLGQAFPVWDELIEVLGVDPSDAFFLAGAPPVDPRFLTFILSESGARAIPKRHCSEESEQEAAPGGMTVAAEGYDLTAAGVPISDVAVAAGWAGVASPPSLDFAEAFGPSGERMWLSQIGETYVAAAGVATRDISSPARYAAIGVGDDRTLLLDKLEDSVPGGERRVASLTPTVVSAWVWGST